METFHKILSIPLFSVGDTQTTVGTLLVVVFVAIATVFIASVVNKAVQRSVKSMSEKNEPTARTYGKVVQLIVWIIGFEIVLHLLGIHLTTLFAAGGFFALGAGFAAKNIVENLFGGVMLRMEQTIRPDDLIVVKDKWIIIKRIGLRFTSAVSYDGEQIYIPNTTLTQSAVINLTRDNRLYRLTISVMVSYDSDLVLVRKSLEQTLDKLDWRSAVLEPGVFITSFGDNGIIYDVHVWIDDANHALSRKSDLYEAIWFALKEQNISVPYPQVDLHLDNDVVDVMASKSV